MAISTQRDAHPGGAHDTRNMVMASLFAALLCVSAWMVIPLGAVPVTLQVALVLLAGLLLPVRWAASAVGAYVAIGAIGLPVFSGGGAGFAWLVGPTGGYILGFVAAAPSVSWLRQRLTVSGPTGETIADPVSVCAGIVVVYVLGWAQLAWVTGMGAKAAFVAGVAPFVIIDLLKGVLAVVVAAAVRRTGVV